MGTENAMIDATMAFFDEHGQLFFAVATVYSLLWTLKPKTRTDVFEGSSNTENHNVVTTPELRVSSGQGLWLRGNLRNELEATQLENKELGALVQKLRDEIEIHQHAQREFAQPTTSSTMTERKMFSGNLEILGFSWVLLIFGVCLVTTRKQRKKCKRLSQPIQRTIKTFHEHSSMAQVYAREVAIPICSRNVKLAAKVVQEHAISDETVVGRQISSVLNATEAYFRREVFPVAFPILRQMLQHVQALVTEVLDGETNVHEKINEVDKTSSDDTVLQELQEKLDNLEETVRTEKRANHQLERKIEVLEGALQGKEDLLYEERMKTRSTKLEHAKFKLKWEEDVHIEKRKLKADAMSEVKEEYKRILCAFIDEHLRYKQDRKIPRVNTVNLNMSRPNITLPLPIMRGISKAIQNSNMSNGNARNQNRDRDQRDENDVNQYCLVDRDEHETPSDDSRSLKESSFWNTNYYFQQRLLPSFIKGTKCSTISKATECSESRKNGTKPSTWMDISNSTVHIARE